MHDSVVCCRRTEVLSVLIAQPVVCLYKFQFQPCTTHLEPGMGVQHVRASTCPLLRTMKSFMVQQSFGAMFDITILQFVYNHFDVRPSIGFTWWRGHHELMTGWRHHRGWEHVWETWWRASWRRQHPRHTCLCNISKPP